MDIEQTILIEKLLKDFRKEISLIESNFEKKLRQILAMQSTQADKLNVEETFKKVVVEHCNQFEILEFEISLKLLVDKMNNINKTVLFTIVEVQELLKQKYKLMPSKVKRFRMHELKENGIKTIALTFIDENNEKKYFIGQVYTVGLHLF